MVLELEWSSVLEATDNLLADNLLGKGAFAQVFIADLGKVRRQQIRLQEPVAHDASPVAIKVLIVEQGAEDVPDDVLEYNKNAEAEELRLMSGYSHRNLCCLLGFSLDGPHKCYVYEFCAGGNLQERLSSEYTTRQ